MRDPKKTVYVYGVPEYGIRPEHRANEVRRHYGGAVTRSGHNYGLSLATGDLGRSFAIEITFGIDNRKDMRDVANFCDYLASYAASQHHLDYFLEPLIEDMLAADYAIEEIARLLLKCPSNCILPSDFPMDIMVEQAAFSEFDL